MTLSGTADCHAVARYDRSPYVGVCHDAYGFCRVFEMSEPLNGTSGGTKVRTTSS